MGTDKELIEMVTRAIPAEDCPVKNAAAMYRRDVLYDRIVLYIEQKTTPCYPSTSQSTTSGTPSKAT